MKGVSIQPGSIVSWNKEKMTVLHLDYSNSANPTALCVFFDQNWDCQQTNVKVKELQGLNMYKTPPRFIINERVSIKSHPRITLTILEIADNQIWCGWHNLKQEWQTYCFTKEALTMALYSHRTDHLSRILAQGSENEKEQKS